MAKMMALALCLRIYIVNGLRETSAVVEKQNSSLWKKCRSSKCNDEEWQLSGDLDEVSRFQNCQVKEGEPMEVHGVTKCEETCTISFAGESKEVKVLRDSGHGKQKCSLQSGHGFCEGTCCAPKCSGHTYETKGTQRLRDCKLSSKSNFKPKGYPHALCEELCTSHSNEEVHVWRNSGNAIPQCDVRGLEFEAVALDFVKQLEVDALKLTSGNHRDLALLRHDKVKNFLKEVGEKVLKPELSQRGFSQEVTSTKNVVIIGDLHGQLFNLIAHLLNVKDHYEPKGLKHLDGSKLLYCDPALQYVFMGDYVDRGERGIELLLLVLAYKARDCPKLPSTPMVVALLDKQNTEKSHKQTAP